MQRRRRRLLLRVQARAEPYCKCVLTGWAVSASTTIAYTHRPPAHCLTLLLIGWTTLAGHVTVSSEEDNAEKELKHTDDPAAALNSYSLSTVIGKYKFD